MMFRSLSQPLRRITRVYRIRSESWRVPAPVRISFSPRIMQIKSLPHIASVSYKQQQDDIGLKSQLDFKQQELDIVKNKLKLLQESNKELHEKVKELEQKNEDQEKIHNQEIVQLKCNLDNSIFEDNNNDFENNELQVIQEENEFQQQKSLAQSDIQPENKDILQMLDQFIDEPLNNVNQSDNLIMQKVKALIDQYQIMEMELEDWKRNYWVLEKKYNQLQLKENQSDNGDIEIEFDFETKQIIRTNKPEKISLLDQNKQLKQEIQSFKDEIDRLKLINSQLQEQQRNMNKQLLENLIVRQKRSEKPKKQLTLINEPANKSTQKIKNQQKYQEPLNQYFSTYFQQQQQQQQQQFIPQYSYTHRHSPMSGNQVQFNRLNTTQQSKDQSVEKIYNFTPNVYSTPIIVKQSSLSPYQKSSKYLQY